MTEDSSAINRYTGFTGNADRHQCDPAAGCARRDENPKVVMRVVMAERMTLVNVINVVLAGASGSPPMPITGVESDVDGKINQPTAVGLVNFYAVYENGVMLVHWVTSWEQNTLGFHIYRGQTESSADAVRLTEIQEMIPGKGTGGGGYVFTDMAVTPNATYWYWLLEIETTGATNLRSPARAVAAPSTPPDWTGAIFLPLINR